MAAFTAIAIGLILTCGAFVFIALIRPYSWIRIPKKPDAAVDGRLRIISNGMRSGTRVFTQRGEQLLFTKITWEMDCAGRGNATATIEFILSNAQLDVLNEEATMVGHDHMLNSDAKLVKRERVRSQA